MALRQYLKTQAVVQALVQLQVIKLHPLQFYITNSVLNIMRMVADI